MGIFLFTISLAKFGIVPLHSAIASSILSSFCKSSFSTDFSSELEIFHHLNQTLIQSCGDHKRPIHFLHFVPFSVQPLLLLKIY